MTVDWRLNKHQREAQAKREQLAALDAQIADLDAMLEEARAFDGYYAAKIAEAERRVSEVATLYANDPGGPAIVQRGNEAEHERRVTERHAIERERDEERLRRTTTTYHGPRRLTFCALDPDHVSRRRAHIVVARDEVARELADIEARLSPGELLQTGQPAAAYVVHRERIAAGRAS